MAALGDVGLRSTYQTTYWFPLSVAPRCVVEEAALVLSHRLSLPTEVIGAEWWLSRMRTSSVAIDFHRDHDIALAERGGPLRHPQRSTVLFLNRCRGGLLAVTRAAPDPANPALAPARHDLDLVTPSPNRFAIFDGRLTHGVLDARNQIPGARLPREPGLRLAVAINFWTQRPLAARDFRARGLHARLAKAPG